MSNNLTKINEFCANKYVIILILLKKNIVLDNNKLSWKYAKDDRI